MKKDIAVLLHTTFTRFPLAKETIKSFKANERFKIYVSDTGAITPEKLDFYKKLEKEGHRTFFTGWDTSPAITRNFLLEFIEEPYVFKVDDDFKYTERVKEQDAINLLKSQEDLGLVAFSVESRRKKSPFIYDVVRKYVGKSEKVYEKTPEGAKKVYPGPRPEVIEMVEPREPLKEYNGIHYQPCDVTPDCWIAKREIFPECNYDENFHVSEGLHSDFFLTIKYKTNWKVAYLPNNVVYTFKYDGEFNIYGADGRRDVFYSKHRFRNLDKRDRRIAKKWGVVSVSKW